MFFSLRTWGWIPVFSFLFFSHFFLHSCQKRTNSESAPNDPHAKPCGQKFCSKDYTCHKGSCIIACQSDTACTELGTICGPNKTCIDAVQPSNCNQNGHEICNDRIDNNCDMLTDLQDPVCSGDPSYLGEHDTYSCLGTPPSCGKHGVCAKKFQECNGELFLPCEMTSQSIADYEPDIELSCEDTEDNDCDSFVDYEDPDCQCEPKRNMFWEDVFEGSECLKKWHWDNWEGGSVNCISVDNESVLEMRSEGNQSSVPMVWAYNVFPNLEQFGWEVRFRFYQLAGYGNSFGMGTNINYQGERNTFNAMDPDGDGNPWKAGEMFVEGLNDVFGINAVGGPQPGLGVSVSGKDGDLTWNGPAEDTGWFVARVYSDFSTGEVTLKVWRDKADGELLFHKKKNIRAEHPKLIFVGHHIIHTDWSGEWTRFYIDYFNIFTMDFEECKK